jgi:Fic family protein
MKSRGEKMRRFNYETIPTELLTPEIMNLVAAIHEYKGKQDLYLSAKPDILESLLSVAKVQSTGSSNRIEGISTSDARLDSLMKESTEPRNRAEEEIAGYREVLKLVHENYEHMTPSENVILQMHRDLYHFSASGHGGKYKATENTIEEKDSHGQRRVRFQPTSVFETPEAMGNLCTELRSAEASQEINPAILSAMFVLDFLCIHPFADGNGRISRLLMGLLLYRSGYMVGKYISIEKQIENTKETYYQALQESSRDWHDGQGSYLPFVRYTLQIILAAYKDFSERVASGTTKGVTKTERISRLLATSLGQWTKSDIRDHYPDISDATIEQTLAKLLRGDEIIKIGEKKGTSYTWKRK